MCAVGVEFTTRDQSPPFAVAHIFEEKIGLAILFEQKWVGIEPIARRKHQLVTGSIVEAAFGRSPANGEEPLRLRSLQSRPYPRMKRAIDKTNQKLAHLPGIRCAVDTSSVGCFLTVGRKGLDVVHAATVKVAQAAQSIFSRLPIDRITVAMKRRLVRRGVPTIDNVAAIERVGENLKNRSGYRILLVDLPEQRWPSAILKVVVVVERPNPIASRIQYPSANDAKAEAKEHIETVAVYRSQFVFRNSIGETFAEGMDCNAGNIAKKRGEIDRRLGIRFRLVAFVVPLLVAVIQR